MDPHSHPPPPPARSILAEIIDAETLTALALIVLVMIMMAQLREKERSRERAQDAYMIHHGMQGQRLAQTAREPRMDRAYDIGYRRGLSEANALMRSGAAGRYNLAPPDDGDWSSTPPSSRYLPGSPTASLTSSQPSSPPSFRGAKMGGGGQAQPPFWTNNKEIVKAFDNNEGTALIHQWMREGRLVNDVNIGTFLHRLGKSKRACDPDILIYFTDALERVTEPVGARSIGSALFGLSRTPDSAALRGFLDVVAYRMDQVVDEFDAQGLGNALYGLQKTGDSPQARAVLGAATKQLMRLPGPNLSARHIGSMLFGCQQMTDSPEIRGFFHVLAQKINESGATLDAQGIGNSFYGMQKCADSEEKYAVMLALAALIEKLDIRLDRQCVGNALYGLQHCKDSPSLRHVLGTLLPKMGGSQSKLKAMEISSALFGLQRAGKSREVLSMLRVMAEKIELGTNDWSATSLNYAFQGLAPMPDTQEKQVVMLALSRRLVDNSYRAESHVAAAAVKCVARSEAFDSEAALSVCQSVMTLLHSRRVTATEEVQHATKELMRGIDEKGADVHKDVQDFIDLVFPSGIEIEGKTKKTLAFSKEEPLEMLIQDDAKPKGRSSISSRATTASTISGFSLSSSRATERSFGLGSSVNSLASTVKTISTEAHRKTQMAVLTEDEEESTEEEPNRLSAVPEGDVESDD